MIKMRSAFPLAVTCFALLCVITTSQAEVRLPHIFGDHMVLQRDQPIPVWGWADPGENVTVTIGEANKTTVADIKTGTELPGGNIEFWPHNYGPANSKGIPNASATLWDFGDEFSAPGDGYGSMQVHNYAAKQTIFAINQWKSGPAADIGIGNSTGKTRDWTFMSNASNYEVKRLRVLVRTK